MPFKRLVVLREERVQSLIEKQKALEEETKNQQREDARKRIYM